MTEPLSAGRPDFFGKDSFTPFIGQVEDVNDPTHSGRVKVRCVGWHPRERKKTQGNDDSLPTDDLPWARVGMPTTHAQQSRIGGKHGLLPGCWVMGFFLDGDEAQDPFILSTFNFTSNTSPQDNRKDTVEKDQGKLKESANGFEKPQASPATIPNTGINTTDEQASAGPGFSNKSDKAGDNVTDDSDMECFGPHARESAASAASKEEFKNPENAVGQKCDVTVADALCGSNAHATEDVQLKLEERMPSQFNRFNYGDIVWEKFQGNYMDLNGILAQLALEICALLKQNVMSMKSEQETRNRQDLYERIKSTNRRNPNVSIRESEQAERESDVFHALMGAFIDQLCSLIMQLLQQQNNSGTGGEGNDNSGGNIGADPVTLIEDPGAPCVTETFMNNFNALVTNAISEANTESRRVVREAAAQDGSGGSSLDQIMGLLSSVAGLGSGMQFPLVDKFTDRTDVHNTQGDASQDQTTREGCKPVRQYNTEEGYLGAVAALAGLASGIGSGGGGGGGTGGGRGGSQLRTDMTRGAWGAINFGGMRTTPTGTIDFTTCEDGKTPKVPDDIFYDTTIPSPGTGVDYAIQPSKPEKQLRVPGENTTPSGFNAVITNISLPSAEEACAKNFVDGTPNVAVITGPGRGYYYHNLLQPQNAFPEVYIRGYNGRPTPVVNEDSGELVAVLTACNSWDPNYPMTPATVIPSDSNNGILSSDPNYDIVLGGFFIQNTGFNYCRPRISIWDRDRGTYGNGQVTPVLSDGRIVDIEIINSGSGFLRIPSIEIVETDPDCRGYGAIVYPIMNVVPRAQSKGVLDPPAVTQSIFCPAKNQQNRFTVIKDVDEMTSNIIQSALPVIPTQGGY